MVARRYRGRPWPSGRVVLAAGWWARARLWVEDFALHGPDFFSGRPAGVTWRRDGSRQPAADRHVVTLVRDDLTVCVAQYGVRREAHRPPCWPFHRPHPAQPGARVSVDD